MGGHWGLLEFATVGDPLGGTPRARAQRLYLLHNLNALLHAVKHANMLAVKTGTRETHTHRDTVIVTLGFIYSCSRISNLLSHRKENSLQQQHVDFV